MQKSMMQSHLKPIATKEQSAREFAFTARDFRFLAQLAQSKTGIVLGENKHDMIYARLSRRLRALGFTNFSDYCALLEGPEGETEFTHLINAVTTNLTHFFRERHHFEHLEKYLLLPALSVGTKRFRIWSAGCSSGMEPYSIAMVLKAAMGANPCDAKILATDIDTTMLARAKAGEYTQDELKNIPRRFVSDIATHAAKQTITMAQPLKQLITFNHLNLLGPWPISGPFDAIFCRNVVIYFNKATQAELFNRMADLLSPSGFLYIGHSENLNNVSNRFTVCGRTIYRKLA
jgi:chemotaxis protein methyltransferase CheR